MEGWRHTNFVDSATSVSSEAEAEAEGEGQGQVKGEGTLTKKSGNVLRVGIFLDFAWLTTRTPHGGASYVRRAGRNRIDRHGGEIERLALQAKAKAVEGRTGRLSLGPGDRAARDRAVSHMQGMERGERVTSLAPLAPVHMHGTPHGVTERHCRCKERGAPTLRQSPWFRRPLSTCTVHPMAEEC